MRGDLVCGVSAWLLQLRQPRCRDARPRRASSSAPTAAGEGASAEIQLNIETLLPVSEKELEIA